MTPEEAYHAARGTDWDYETVYRELAAAGLDSAPGTAAEILVDEVRDVICPGRSAPTTGSRPWRARWRPASMSPQR